MDYSLIIAVLVTIIYPILVVGVSTLFGEASTKFGIMTAWPIFIVSASYFVTKGWMEAWVIIGALALICMVIAWMYIRIISGED